MHADTQSLGKPVLFEEFGKADGRDPFYQAAYDAVENSLKSEGPLKGALFWMMLGDGQDECGGNVKDGGLFGVTEGDSAFTIARNSAQASKDLYSGPAATCSKKADASAAVSAAG